ncbi:DUF7529 family protein [Halocatena pleomorpha]|uniref:Uncharacterized protein n=1 Tax=Halocatena pleomorpha TaxID=1785090 RepID=A0A3P3RGL9_9EURY|nr:hypothetical protein [Halocatena pleomorpha]RRJ32515.1 hypothetical protein EIK79_04635 [Halocatena pleomorpha]
MDVPIESVSEQWDAVIDDMEATANDYRAAGWTVIELHPGDVTPLPGEPPGFDVLVPDNEFSQLRTAVAEAAFDATELYRAEDGGVMFVLAVTRDAEREIAVCCPLYYDHQAAMELAEQADDGLIASIRTLTGDQTITIDYDDFDLFETGSPSA